MKHPVKCPQCEGKMVNEIRKSFLYTSSVGVIDIPQMHIIVCSQCQEVLIPDSEVKRAEGLLIKKVLHKKSLSNTDYSFLLHFLNLSPNEAAQLFQKDKSTMSRWLSGKSPMDPLVKKLILKMASEESEGEHTLREVLKEVI